MEDANAGDNILAGNANWRFDGDTVKTFEDHVSKSVPFYDVGHKLVLALSDFFVQRDSKIFEIGCSTGILSHALAERVAAKNGTVTGLDVVPDMIAFAEKKYRRDNLRFVCADILDVDMAGADLIVSYYVVQFISPARRQLVLDRIYQSLNWGGALVMFEKVRAADARFQDIATALYQDFKLEQGYTCDEIVAKARSLKGVLEPFSTQGNIDLMERAGFLDIATLFKYICFEGFVAIK